MTDIDHLLSWIQDSGRKLWRLGDVKHWPSFRENNMLTLTWLEADIDYRKVNLNTLKRGKRVIPRWVNELNRHDLIFLMDKTHYYGIAIAEMEYHPYNPTIDIGEEEGKPAIRVQWVHQPTEPTLHPFKIKSINPDTFSLLEQLGFSILESLQFLSQSFPNVLTDLAELLSSDYKKTPEIYVENLPEKIAEINEKYPNPNIILYGPPGTGKTYSSIDIAVEILGKDTGNHEKNHHIFKQHLHQQIEWVTFHQNYAYEDFIQGLRPVSNASKSLQFELHDGIFKRLAERATLNYLAAKKELTESELYLRQQIEGKQQQNTIAHYSLNEPKAIYQTAKVAPRQLKNYLLIIDEINRANMARVFGELISLLEKDKRLGQPNELQVTLPSGQIFAVPPNLYLIGTMNTADKSIALLDIALRRRFDFKPFYPKYDIPHLAEKELLKKLNKKIRQLRGRDFQIGQAYFLTEKDKIFNLQYILNNKVIPLLYEYFRNDEKAIQQVLDAANIVYRMSEGGVIEAV